MTDLKDTLRQEARQRRAQVDPARESAQAAADLFFSHVNPSKNLSIAGYWPKGREFNPVPILERALLAGHICALPLVQKGSRVLRFARWDKDTVMEEGAHGIMQPAVNEQTQWVEPDIILVPLLAFDKKGYRLGQGGGYYDATLADLRSRKDILAVGVAYAQQACLSDLPVEEHDEKLDWVITPKAAHFFK